MPRTIGGDIFGGPSGARQQEATLLHRGNDFFAASAPIMVEPYRPFVATGLDDEISFVINLGRSVEFKKQAIAYVVDHRCEAALARADRSKGSGKLDGISALVRRQPGEKAFSVRSLVRAFGLRPFIPKTRKTEIRSLPVSCIAMGRVGGRRGNFSFLFLLFLSKVPIFGIRFSGMRPVNRFPVLGIR